MYTQAIEDNLKDVSQLPYFEGDFLQGTLEREIPRLQGIEETKVDVCVSLTLLHCFI